MPQANGHEVLKVKLCLVGEAAVGKTSLVRRFVLDQFDDRYVQTLGAKVSKREVHLPGHHGHPLRVAITIWDIMGSPGIPELMREGYFYRAQGILAVCDATHRNTLLALEDWHHGLAPICGDVPWLVLANKADLADLGEVTEEDLEDLLGGLPHLFTSAKTGRGIEEAFQSLAVQVVDGLARHPKGHRPSLEVLEP